jgi:hypothetical protein
MNVLEFVPTAASESPFIFLGYNLKPDFTRAQFSSHDRVHTESRCNHCGFRINGSTTDSFDHDEQEHAVACKGSETE